MRTDGRTDMANVTVAFRSFVNAPKNDRVGVRSCDKTHHSGVLFKRGNVLSV